MDKFTAATWNVYWGTEVDDLAPTLIRTRKRGVGLYLLQEASNPDLPTMFHDVGLETFKRHPQYMLAWDPKVWTAQRTWGQRLADTQFYRAGQQNPVTVEMAMAVLTDAKGRTLMVGSYHTPSSVQQRRKPIYRLRALHEAAHTWGALAHNSHTTAVLFGGDDNVDEDGAFGPWRFLLRSATGLRQVQAPHGTHGHRRIDDFRVRHLKPLGGYVVNTASDHHMHVHTFGWSKR